MVFSSDELASFWTELDKFEGEAYQRVKTSVCLECGQVVDAYVYVVSSSELHEN